MPLKAPGSGVGIQAAMTICPVLPYKLPVKYAAPPKTRISAIRIIALSVGPSVTPILLGVGCTMAIIYLPCIYFPPYEDLVGCGTFPLRTQRDLDMCACPGKRPRPGLMMQAGVLIGHRGPGDDIDDARSRVVKSGRATGFRFVNSQPESHNCGKPQCNWRRRPWTSCRLSSIESSICKPSSLTFFDGSSPTSVDHSTVLASARTLRAGSRRHEVQERKAMSQWNRAIGRAVA